MMSLKKRNSIIFPSAMLNMKFRMFVSLTLHFFSSSAIYRVESLFFPQILHSLELREGNDRRLLILVQTRAGHELQLWSADFKVVCSLKIESDGENHRLEKLFVPKNERFVRKKIIYKVLAFHRIIITENMFVTA